MWCRITWSQSKKNKKWVGQLEQSQLIILKYICALEPVWTQGSWQFIVLVEKGWNIGWVLLFHILPSVPGLVLSFFPFSLPPWGENSSRLPKWHWLFWYHCQLFHQLLIALEPPSLATGSGLSSWIHGWTFSRSWVPPRIPSPSPT